MSEANTGPSSWESFFQGLGGVVLDGARARLIDQEYRSDTNNIPDNVDLLNGLNTGVNSTGGVWNVSLKPEYLALGILATMAGVMLWKNL